MVESACGKRTVSAVPATRLCGSTARSSRSMKPECRKCPMVAVSTRSIFAISAAAICPGMALTTNIGIAFSAKDMVLRHRHTAAHRRDPVEIHPGARRADAVRALRDQMAPGVDHHRVAPAPFPAVGMGAGLADGDEAGLGFYGACPRQHLPMVLAGHQST